MNQGEPKIPRDDGGTADDETEDVNLITNRASHEESKSRNLSAIHITLLVAPGVVLAMMDQSVNDVALITIAKELDETMAAAQWVVLIYYLVTASTLVTMGRLGDKYCKRLVFLSGMAVFVGTSVACGLCSSLKFLVVFRALQGLGGAAMLANSTALIADCTDNDTRKVALGYSSSTMGLSLAIGPTIGGFLTQSFGWPAIFFINLPIGLLGLIVAWQLPGTIPHPEVSMDPVGSGLFFITVSCLLYSASSVQTSTEMAMAGWGLLTSLMAVALASWHRYAAQPLVPRSLCTRGILCSVLSSGGLFFAVSLCRFMLPYYLQTSSMGYTQAEAGAALGAQPVAMALTGLFAGKVSNAVECRVQTSVALATILTGVVSE